jgi:hypothetical protein
MINNCLVLQAGIFIHKISFPKRLKRERNHELAENKKLCSDGTSIIGYLPGMIKA